AVLFEQARYPDAACAFREAARLRPDFARVHVNLGLALERVGDLVGAEEALREALRLRPDDAVARTNLGTVLRRQRRATDAEAVYRDGAVRSGSARSHFDLGRTLFEQRRYPEAAEAFREAIRLRRDDTRARRALGLT